MNIDIEVRILVAYIIDSASKYSTRDFKFHQYELILSKILSGLVEKVSIGTLVQYIQGRLVNKCIYILI